MQCWRWPVMSSVCGPNQRGGCLIWRSHSAVNGFHWRAHCIEIFKATPAFISPRLTCCSPLKHDIHHEVPRDFPKSNINTSMFSVHKLKLKITCSCLSAKCNMHSKTCLHLLQSDSKRTQLSLLWFKALDSSSTALTLTFSQLCYGLRLPAIVCR